LGNTIRTKDPAFEDDDLAQMSGEVTERGPGDGLITRNIYRFVVLARMVPGVAVAGDDSKPAIDS